MQEVKAAACQKWLQSGSRMGWDGRAPTRKVGGDRCEFPRPPASHAISETSAGALLGGAISANLDATVAALAWRPRGADRPRPGHPVDGMRISAPRVDQLAEALMAVGLAKGVASASGRLNCC